MRTLDRALPAVDYDDAATVASWPVRPVVAIYNLLSWDDPSVLWDDPTVVWDGGYLDATCAWTGLEIDSGEPDTAGLVPACRAVVQLDNRDGAWSVLRADGTAHRFGPGTPLHIWAHNASGDWWLFSGRIARYDQRADDTVEIEAFDVFSDLAQPVGTYTAGTAGQTPGARLAAILAVAGETATPARFATRTVNLTAQTTEAAPLEEMQTVVLSDGGVLFVDADGTLTSTARSWAAGRSDQTVFPVASDNVCTAGYVVWDPTISVNDDNLADRVVLENVAGVRAAAGAAAGYTFALTGQQWTTQLEADILAAFLLTQQAPRQIAIEEFSLHLLDPRQPDIWRAVDWRRLDLLRFIHDQKVAGGALLRIDVTAPIDAILHEITPDGWQMTISTSRVKTSNVPILYDTGHLYDTAQEYEY